jgi:RecA/RadA recombinase
MIEFEGEKRPRIIVPTKLFSFDRALKGGLNLPAAYEVYGLTHVGKSSFVYYLAAMCRPQGKIALADFEHFDTDYLTRCLVHAGFQGKVNILSVDTGEIALTAIRDCLLNTEYGAAILDSVGALQTEQEIKETISLSQRMGLKPKLMGRGMRAAMYALLRNQAGFFLTNHLHPIITMGRGMQTSGGLAIHNLSAGRIRLKTEEQTDEYIIVQGRIDKFRFGGKGGNFKVVIIPGHGVHRGLSSVVDALWYAVADKDRVVKIGNKSYGYMKNLAQQAIDGEIEIFEDFERVLHDKVGTHAGFTSIEEDNSDEIGDETDS